MASPTINFSTNASNYGQPYFNQHADLPPTAPQPTCQPLTMVGRHTPLILTHPIQTKLLFLPMLPLPKLISDALVGWLL